jgi:hypothetical protein
MSLMRWFALFADQHMQSMMAILAIKIIDLPGLCDLLWLPQAYLLLVSRCLGAYQMIGAVDLGKIRFLGIPDHLGVSSIPNPLEQLPPASKIMMQRATKGSQQCLLRLILLTLVPFA